MFGIGTPEIIGIVLIILLVYGPDRLPEMIKKVVGFLRQIKSMTDEVSHSVTQEIHRIERSAEIKEARNLIEQNRNLLQDSKKDLHQALNQPIQEVTEVKKENKDEPHE
jgi:Tat protein translocase TatB subunit